MVLAWMGQREQPVIPIVGVSCIEQLDSAEETRIADSLAVINQKIADYPARLSTV